MALDELTPWAYPTALVEGTILDRRKRFLADVELPDGERVVAHLANTGRMTGCWEPNAPCRLSKSNNPKRKLAWSVEQCRVDGRWVMVNTARTNRVVEAALRAGWLGLEGEVRSEVRWPTGGRADFRVGDTWVEVKGVTLVQNGVYKFPDTVSKRATEHLNTLIQARGRGEPAVLVLVACTAAGRWIEPAWDLDPAFADALLQAQAAEVRIEGARMALSASRLQITGSVEVRPTAPQRLL